MLPVHFRSSPKEARSELAAQSQASGRSQRSALRAKQETETKQRLGNMSFSEFCNSSSAQSLREKSRRTLKAHVATRTYEQMQTHAAWSGGLQADSFESGI